MFKFSELRQIHLEISNRCQASCPMCSRNYHGGQDNPLINGKDWTLDEFKQIMSPEVLMQVKSFYFCGNYGDPIVNQDLKDMIEYAAGVNPDVYIRVHTNASARSLDWWRDLARVMPNRHAVIFAIDGLEDTHSKYRIGTDYNKIIANAQAFIDAGGTAEWAFIRFKHNEHQVEDARKKAEDMGFSLFHHKNSARFIADDKFAVYDKDGKTVDYLEAPTGSKLSYVTQDVIDNYKTIVKESKIDCAVLRNKEIYIDAYRNVYPCCFLGAVPYNLTYEQPNTQHIMEEMLDQHKELVAELGDTCALNKSVKDIIDSDIWQNVWYKYWEGEKKLIKCARTCGVMKENNLSKPTDQIEEQIEVRPKGLINEVNHAYLNGEFDMTKFKKTGTLFIPFDKEWTNVGISLSGGADSALLAYLLASFVEEDQQVTFHMISHIRLWKTRPWQRYDSYRVYSWLRTKFPHINFVRHENFIPPELEYSDKGANIVDEYGNVRSGDQIIVRSHAEWLAFENKFDAWFSAKSKNPSDPNITKGMPDREVEHPDVNELIKKHEGTLACHPFLYIEKDWIVKQYVDNDIMDLFHTTRSCEGDFEHLDYTNYVPGKYVPECGECFWCQERNWAKEKNNVE